MLGKGADARSEEKISGQRNASSLSTKDKHVADMKKLSSSANSGTDSPGSGSEGSGSTGSNSALGLQQRSTTHSDSSRGNDHLPPRWHDWLGPIPMHNTSLEHGLRESSILLGKRSEPEQGSSSSSHDSWGNSAPDVKEWIKRLSRDNKKLLAALNKSQEEVEKLKSVIDMHERDAGPSSSTEDNKAQTRYWTDAEHQRFLDALQSVGPKDVKAIAQHVGTRSATQVRTHAQKYFIKLARMKKSAEEAGKAGGPGSSRGAWWLQVCLCVCVSGGAFVHEPPTQLLLVRTAPLLPRAPSHL
jgi:SHAQKYF class myb-like DNA-binding protein